jgi:DNA-3-methyladenine glycosylase
MSTTRLDQSFFAQDVLEVAPQLLGQTLCRRYESGEEVRLTLTETEAYRGEEDLASHARFGKTKRNQVMYGKAGSLYVYLIYGRYWMLNVVTGNVGEPQAVLIRGARTQSGKALNGPGKIGQFLQLSNDFYGQNSLESEKLWFEKGKKVLPGNIVCSPRIGVAYAGQWAHKPWRFELKNNSSSW